MSAAAISTVPGQPEQGAITHKWLISIAVMIGAVLEILDGSIVNVALPHMQGSFSASVDEIAWVVTSYLVANGIMIPMTGWISARFGRKRYFLASVAVFVLASGLCGAARTLNEMVIFRLIQGAAGAAMIPSSQAIMMETFPPNEQQLAMGVWGMGMMVAPIMGPTLGGWITDSWNWRWCFYINLPVGLLAFVMVSAFLHDPEYLRQHRSRDAKVDYLGIILLVVGLGLAQIVLDRGQRADWFASPWVIYATVAAAGAFLILTVNELRISDPIIDLRILAIPVFSLSVVLMIVVGFAVYGTTLLIPVFLQEFMGYTPWQAGLAVMPAGIGSIFTMMLAGQMGRYGYDTRPLIGIGFVIVAYSVWQMSHWNLQVDFWHVMLPRMEFGTGMGLVFPPLSTVTLACVSRERIGYASSLFNLMRNTGAALGISYMTTVLIRNEQTHQSYLAEHFSVFDAWKMSHTAAPLPGAHTFAYLPQIITGQTQSLGMVYRMIQAQAAVLSFADIYRVLAFGLILVAPTFLLIKRSALSSAGAPMH